MAERTCEARAKFQYLPTTRGVRGGGYSAELYLVGPEGGRVLVDESVKRINARWP
jgi:hypothetical protein